MLAEAQIQEARDAVQKLRKELDKLKADLRNHEARGPSMGCLRR